MRVKPYPVRLVAALLRFAGPVDALSYLLRRFATPFVGQILEFQPRHLKMYIDPVEERPGYF